MRKDRKRAVVHVSATTAAKNFGTLVDRVRESQATYIVERSGIAVARILPISERRATVKDLVSLLKERRGAGEAFAHAVTDGVRALNRRERPRDPWAS